MCRSTAATYTFPSATVTLLSLPPISRLQAVLRSEETDVFAAPLRQGFAQKALIETLPIIHPGVTEIQIANALSLQLIRAGSDTPLPFSPIVAGGPNSANPHAFPTTRSLQDGDLLVIDWGASNKGYLSDITRTFVIGRAHGELSDIAEIVHEANRAARATVRPGVPAGGIDRSARDVIVKAGYGDYFIHRTGHGLGLEAHEAPYIRQDNNQKLTTGMTFTIEPGIYVPDVGGVRIEDDVLVTQEGIDCLTDLRRDLIELPR